jgi:hypothetical protein
LINVKLKNVCSGFTPFHLPISTPYFCAFGKGVGCESFYYKFILTWFKTYLHELQSYFWTLTICDFIAFLQHLCAQKMK